MQLERGNRHDSGSGRSVRGQEENLAGTTIQRGEVRYSMRRECSTWRQDHSTAHCQAVALSHSVPACYGAKRKTPRALGGPAGASVG
jgi:hypothetical protein